MSEVTTTVPEAQVVPAPKPPQVTQPSPSQPNRGMGLYWKLAKGVVFFALAAAGVGLGLLLVQWNPRMAAKYSIGTSGGFKILSHPDAQSQDVSIGVIASQIDKAKSEVLVLGGRLTSRKILEALLERQRANIDVKLILPKNANSDGVRSYLRQNNFQKAYLSPTDFDEQIIVIDNSILLIGTVPWSAKAAKSMSGSVIASGDSLSARAARSYIQDRVLESTPLP